ncbi:MAG: glycosyltransferase, partial [Lachnospiraceae bacterium]|nr:glycosyltransferase [Lachnospiraceae bacterium]
VTDEENKALMERCRIFVFPSKLEGFGIPPLEALACGAKIAISRASCLPEIYGECAVYFDPDDYEVNIEDLEKQAIVGVDKLLKKYSWEKSAKDWYEIFLAAVST